MCFWGDARSLSGDNEISFGATVLRTAAAVLKEERNGRTFGTLVGLRRHRMSFVGREGNDRMREQSGAEGGEDKGGLSSLKDLLLRSMGEEEEEEARYVPPVRSFQELPTNDVVGGASNASIDRPQSSISPLAIERASGKKTLSSI